jgi:DNA-binding NtrC family response regulator
MQVESTGVTILVVEDEPVVSTLVRLALARLGHGIVLVEDAQTAIRVAQAAPSRFDLVIADALVRGANAGVALKSLTNNSSGAPVLFISGSPLQLLIEGGYLEDETIDDRRGFFLQKPFTAPQLVSTVRQILAWQHGAAEAASLPTKHSSVTGVLEDKLCDAGSHTCGCSLHSRSSLVG